jgi:signal transduction histidine kinase
MLWRNVTAYLHDSVTQVLFSASLVAEVLPRIWSRDPAMAMESLEELRRLTRGALAEMRTMLLELRPYSLLKTPLPELLGQLTEATVSRAGLQFLLSVEQIPSLPDEVQISFYRIAQESLNNVVKHAGASQVKVSLQAKPLAPDSAGDTKQDVKLTIEDDGVGYTPGVGRPEHMGLGIMHERAKVIGANLSIDSQPGIGTQVTLCWTRKVEKENESN